MAVFNEPTKWAQSLGATANADVIPNEAGAMDVDISKIFPAAFSVPLAQGGKAIPRRTLNGILKLLGDWLYYYQQGGVASYSNTVDYVAGRVVLYNNKIWRCIKANGADNPQIPTEGEYWVELSDSSDLNGKADRSLSNIDNTANILMAHNAMPSTRVVSFTVGTNAQTYTAPADGYVMLYCQVKPNDFCHLTSANGSAVLFSFADNVTSSPQAQACYIPISKGYTFQIDWRADKPKFHISQFVYAQGAVSEA